MLSIIIETQTDGICFWGKGEKDEGQNWRVQVQAQWVQGENGSNDEGTRNSVEPLPEQQVILDSVWLRKETRPDNEGEREEILPHQGGKGKIKGNFYFTSRIKLKGSMSKGSSRLSNIMRSSYKIKLLSLTPKPTNSGRPSSPKSKISRTTFSTTNRTFYQRKSTIL